MYNEQLKKELKTLGIETQKSIKILLNCKETAKAAYKLMDFDEGDRFKKDYFNALDALDELDHTIKFLYKYFNNEIHKG